MCRNIENDREDNLNILGVIIVVEMVLGGAGRLIMFGPITIRYSIYAFSLIWFVIDFYKKNCKIRLTVYTIATIVFLVSWLVAFLHGVIADRPIADIVKSSQGYLYIMMIFPMARIINSKKKAIQAYKIFVNSSVIVAIIMIVIFVVYYINPYTFDYINNLLMRYEIGHLSIRYSLPSVFFKTSPYLVIAAAGNFLSVTNGKKMSLINISKTFALFIACVITMTMGIWIALLFSILFILLFYIKGFRKRIFVVITTIIAFIVSWGAFGNYISSAITNRISTSDSSFIIKADQLVTLLEEWVENIFFGNGFGVEVIFVSEIAVRKMIKFELFWIEILVYMGVIGLFSYLLLLGTAVYNGINTARCSKNTYKVIVITYVLGILSISIVSSVNPFLNNPIGLGFVALAISSISAFSKVETHNEILIERK